MEDWTERRLASIEISVSPVEKVIYARLTVSCAAFVSHVYAKGRPTLDGVCVA